jgi:hypothetical protein
VTSIVIIVVIIASITVECMLSFVLTGYVVVDSMVTTFESLLVVHCKEKNINEIIYRKSIKIIYDNFIEICCNDFAIHTGVS